MICFPTTVSPPCLLNLQTAACKSHPDNVIENVEALFSLSTVLKRNVRVDGNL